MRSAHGAIKKGMLVMLTLSLGAVTTHKFLKAVSMVSAVWALSTAACLAGHEDRPTVRHIGHLDSTIALRIIRQVHLVSFDAEQNSPILLQGRTMDRLKHGHKRGIKTAYQAGYTIVLLDASMQHIRALHEIVGEGVSYRSKTSRR